MASVPSLTAAATSLVLPTAAAALGDALTQTLTAPNLSRRASNITDLPIDWTATGVDTQTVHDFATYLDCVEHKLADLHSPDDCLTPDTLARAKELETVFETLYWLPCIEPALFYQLDRLKPKDCSAEQARCRATTPESGICPPWRYYALPAPSTTTESAPTSGPVSLTPWPSSTTTGETRVWDGCSEAPASALKTAAAASSASQSSWPSRIMPYALFGLSMFALFGTLDQWQHFDEIWTSWYDSFTEQMEDVFEEVFDE